MERRAIVVRGIVQGVGFRPFVYNLAARLRLHGFVKNQTGSLLIEVEGEPPSLERFLADLADRPPLLAYIEHLSWERRPPRGEGEFRIESSEADAASPVFISPDVATCPDCLAELLDPRDRRHGYPFLNCTNCGPRLTIITGAPYDRPRTTMASFPMCPACRAEYEDPANRRFHAQPPGIAAVVLSGGVFLNALLTAEVSARLRGDGFRVPENAIGRGFHEAVRGVLSHHVVIRDGKIANYHPYPPTPWNASPRDTYGTAGPYEDAVQNTPIFEENGPDKFKGIDIIRTVRSFDPCLPCGVHMYLGDGKLLDVKHVPMFGAQH